MPWRSTTSDCPGKGKAVVVDAPVAGPGDGRQAVCLGRGNRFDLRPHRRGGRDAVAVQRQPRGSLRPYRGPARFQPVVALRPSGLRRAGARRPRHGHLLHWPAQPFAALQLDAPAARGRPAAPQAPATFEGPADCRLRWRHGPLEPAEGPARPLEQPHGGRYGGRGGRLLGQAARRVRHARARRSTDCFTALSDNEQELSRLMQYRFERGEELQGHTFGNLLITTLTEVEGDFGSAVKSLNGLLNLSGSVYPATTEPVSLVVTKESGEVVRGESAVRTAPGAVSSVEIEPERAKALPEVVEAVERADVIALI